jgi:hypothetical protein
MNMSQVDVTRFEAFLVLRIVEKRLAKGETRIANDGF